jgi:hypothetical protein
MANENQVALLQQGVAEWNAWCKGPNRGVIDLSGANLSGANVGLADLNGADLSKANLSKAYLGAANLTKEDLSGADLSTANLSGADLSAANLSGAKLTKADLRAAYLSGVNLTTANLRAANLSGANLQEARLFETVLGDVDLSAVAGLETCQHGGPSIIDYRTLQRSGRLPLPFLRGVGLPDSVIEYLSSLPNQPIQLYSCFISYSSKDKDFAERNCGTSFCSFLGKIRSPVIG